MGLQSLSFSLDCRIPIFLILASVTFSSLVTLRNPHFSDIDFQALSRLISLLALVIFFFSFLLLKMIKKH